MFKITFLLSLHVLSFVLRTMRLTWLYGALKLTDAEAATATVNSVGQQPIWTATQEYLARVRASIAAATTAFVERQTDRYTDSYKLPGGGRLQRRGPQSQPGAVKGSGGWDTAYPLEDFGDQVAGDDVTLAYLSVEEYQRAVDTVVIRDVNTVRFEMLKALFNPTNATFTDPRGNLTIRRLANSDGSLYPPVIGSESEADDTHYLESGYAASAISDTNNPYTTIRAEIEEHFGEGNIVVFIHPDQETKTKDLTDFTDAPSPFITPGASTATVTDMPNVPGKVIGRVSGVWVSVWHYIPTGWMFGLDLNAPAPLIERVDPAFTGLGTGLQLVSTDQIYPFTMAFWRHRFGYGVGNRLNGVAFELGTGGTYGAPTIYA